jgi:hypothetical protein
MLPAVVPAALALAIGLEAILPVVILLGERNRMPAAMVGWGDVLTGNGLTDSERPALADAFPVVYVNHILAPETRTLLVGEATPLYYRGHASRDSPT